MGDRPVLYDVDAGVATITLNRPDAGNAIDLAVAEGLYDAATAASTDPGVRAVLVRGEGKAFCVGGDLRSFSGRDDLPRHLADVTTPLHAAISRLARNRAPVVAAVQGSAAGAGFSLAASADLVVSGASARFVLAYTKIGLSPDGSGSWFLPRLVGLRRALDLALTNRVLSADEALAWGLVSTVVDDDAVDDEGRRLAAELAQGPTSALGAAKALLRDSLDTTLETQMERETIAIVANAGRPDSREGMAAFLEKRAPRFTGQP